jgi:hypothetical protein
MSMAKQETPPLKAPGHMGDHCTIGMMKECCHQGQAMHLKALLSCPKKRKRCSLAGTWGGVALGYLIPLL